VTLDRSNSKRKSNRGWRIVRRVIVLLFLTLIVAAFVAWRVILSMPGQSYQGELPALSEPQRNLSDELRGDVETLAIEIGERHVGKYPQLMSAYNFISEEFTKAGYKVQRLEYKSRDVTVYNMVAEIVGSKLPDEIVVVGAHYDTFNGTPGANDNGSGTAAMLALARMLAGKKTDRTLRFVALTNEEPPFFQTEDMGSLVYARDCRRRDDNIVAMLSLETIGYFSDEPGSQQYPFPFDAVYPSEGNFIGVVGNVSSRKLVRRIVGLLRENAKIPAEGGAIPGFVTGVGWSDHWSFWQEGYPAVMLTDTAIFRYPHYHKASDTPDKLDYDRMALVVEGLKVVVDDLVKSPDE
jgi:Zn-dependent M28 family amino/carboxypeptidase